MSERIVTLPIGTMVNQGPHEDDYPIITTEFVPVKILGPEKDHALPIEFVSGEPPGQWYWHQPERREKSEL
ncbi:hypothetical protein A2773_06720 [Candidatus Gottesmanbacteria bacterium RIFCSPHIGHO2_01_FULL_39_10]|uniref:Uncharacterized protein n=1 Tax=Candidatus Gottesmanbacteria bacterium RIFCSPHIGHO2_01_FULL_39_10 TaxID=1798375 RepID=A0A1F5ZQ93_9BACT|nr:MAG: hypothetical protein A2773_06720 [Candidatus Gottesmanbacteria bacterium RIFCSPHIGHO2_01_FULL_39_10]